MTKKKGEKEKEKEPVPALEPPWPYRVIVFDGGFFGAVPVDTSEEDE